MFWFLFLWFFFFGFLSIRRYELSVSLFPLSNRIHSFTRTHCVYIFICKWKRTKKKMEEEKTLTVTSVHLISLFFTLEAEQIFYWHKFKLATWNSHLKNHNVCIFSLSTHTHTHMESATFGQHQNIPNKTIKLFLIITSYGIRHHHRKCERRESLATRKRPNKIKHDKPESVSLSSYARFVAVAHLQITNVRLCVWFEFALKFFCIHKKKHMRRTRAIWTTREKKATKRWFRVTQKDYAVN